MSAGLPEDFELSRPRRQDAAEVAALIVEMELAQEGEAETTPADIVREWETMDTDRDTWLVRKDGRLVGVRCNRAPTARSGHGWVRPP